MRHNPFDFNCQNVVVELSRDFPQNFQVCMAHIDTSIKTKLSNCLWFD